MSTVFTKGYPSLESIFVFGFGFLQMLMQCEWIIYAPVSGHAGGNLPHMILPSLSPSADCVSTQGNLKVCRVTRNLGCWMRQAHILLLPSPDPHEPVLKQEINYYVQPLELWVLFFVCFWNSS